MTSRCNNVAAFLTHRVWMANGPYPVRRAARIFGYDYRTAGAYFATVCAIGKREIFGQVAGDQLRLTWIGQIVAEELRRIPTLRPDVKVDTFVVMPNHLHAIIVLRSDAGAALPAVVNRFKGIVTRRVRSSTAGGFEVWQRGYYERIIRDERELDIAREYIELNPTRWAEDRENVRRRPR